jgi:uncharacterized protein
MFRHLGWLFTLAFGCSHAAPLPRTAPDPSAPPPLAFGETFQLVSKVLGETRVINVFLPPGYTEATERYPVLYMPDGGVQEDFAHVAGLVHVSSINAVIHPRIVVGIANTDRRRDLAGPTTVPQERASAPHAGGSKRFRQFLRDELVPHIAAHYRITDESAIVGESLAGLFVIETLLDDPALFDTYIAVDPSLQWNTQAVARSAPARFAAWTPRPIRLYLATADEPDIQAGVAVLVAAIREAAPSGLSLTFEPMPDEHHNTIYPMAARKAFRALFGR